jgi:hypothetical protein
MAKDQINGYQCPTCGAVTVTIDVDDGATPMMLRCRKTPGCEGVAQSMWYRVPSDIGEPEWEWFRPSKAATRRMDAGMRDHIERGGLDLRRRGR